MANLHGYGSTDVIPMIRNYSMSFDEDTNQWLLCGRSEGCTVRLSSKESDSKVLDLWKSYLINNTKIQLEPDYV